MSIAKLRLTKAKGKAAQRSLARQRRHARILKKLRGTADRPRLVVRRSLRHMEAQLVDDERGICITGISTRSKLVEGRLAKDRRKTEASKVAGMVLAERIREKGIEQVVFDRGGYRYHGRVRAFAEGVREGGLKI